MSKDGKTANEICKGKHAKVLGNEFGEQVLWKRRQVGTHQSKLNARWVLRAVRWREADVS